MHVAMLLEMATEAAADRVALGSVTGGLTYAALLQASHRVAHWVEQGNVGQVAFIGLRSARTPEWIGFVDQLPDTGKLRRRTLKADLTSNRIRMVS